MSKQKKTRHVETISGLESLLSAPKGITPHVCGTGTHRDRKRDQKLRRREGKRDEEEDPALDLLRDIQAAQYGDDIWGDVDDCLEAGKGDSEALRLLKLWREGSFQDKDWREVKELIGE